MHEAHHDVDERALIFDGIFIINRMLLLILLSLILIKKYIFYRSSFYHCLLRGVLLCLRYGYFRQEGI